MGKNPCARVKTHLAQIILRGRIPMARGWGLEMRNISAFVGLLALGACATASDVMDTGNGTYMISAHAAPVRGGAAGANQVAYKDANKFCQAKGGHAIVLDANSRDVYQGGFGGSYNRQGGSFGGGMFAAGNADLHFRCGN